MHPNLPILNELDAAEDTLIQALESYKSLLHEARSRNTKDLPARDAMGESPSLRTPNPHYSPSPALEKRVEQSRSWASVKLAEASTFFRDFPWIEPQPKCAEKVALVPDQARPVSGVAHLKKCPYEAPSPPIVKAKTRPDRSLPTGVHKCTSGYQATIWLGKSCPHYHRKSLCLGVYSTPELGAYVRNLVISHLGLSHPLEPNVPNPGPRIREKVIASASRRLVNYGLNPITV